MRATSARRRAITGAAKPVHVGKANNSPLVTAWGRMAYEGDDAVKCPECGVSLRPKKDGKLRRHARYGHMVTRKLAPCRGWVSEYN